MTDPLVSICIPTYNGTEFLRQCLQSCFDQSFNDYEIVICDDGSSDGTVQLVKEIAGVNPKVKFIQNPQNLGLVGNWNKCVAEARGKWIKFVFQDDYISPDCLREFVKSISENTRLVVSERNFILPENADDSLKNYYHHVVRTLVNTTTHKGSYFASEQISRLAVENMSMNFIAEPSLTFFRKDVVSEIGLFNPDLKQICDFEFVLRIATTFGLTYIPKKLCAFRIHANTTTSANVASNYFVLHYIEPLLLSYFMVYGENFKKFRSQLPVWHRFKLALYFKLKAYQASEANKAEGMRHYLFAEETTEFLPVKKAAKASVFIKLLAALRG